jgi:predicted Abi (CAAX) family protease
MLNALERAAVRHCVAKSFSKGDSGMDDKDWCKLQGVSLKWLSRRKNEPQHLEFQKAVEAGRRELEDSVDPTALVMRDWALEEAFVQYKKADSSSEKRQWLKQIKEDTAHVDMSGQTIDYSEVSDEDLLNMVMNRGLTPSAMTQRELASLAKGG